jgi:hypothetical protein
MRRVSVTLLIYTGAAMKATSYTGGRQRYVLLLKNSCFKGEGFKFLIQVQVCTCSPLVKLVPIAKKFMSSSFTVYRNRMLPHQISLFTVPNTFFHLPAHTYQFYPL